MNFPRYLVYFPSTGMCAPRDNLEEALELKTTADKALVMENVSDIHDSVIYEVSRKAEEEIRYRTCDHDWYDDRTGMVKGSGIICRKCHQLMKD